MRKYRCNRILEDRKISRRLCAPFFFPPFVRERPRPVQGRTLPSSVSQPRLQKYLFRTRMIRGRIERARHANSIRAFVACSKKIHRKTIPKLFLVHYSSVKARKRALHPSRGGRAGCDFDPPRAIVAFPAWLSILYRRSCVGIHK